MSTLDQRASLGTTAGLAPGEQTAGPQVANHEGDTRIRAVTFNVRHGLGLDGHQDLERTAQVLRELAPDIAGLQEVEEGAERSGGIDQAAWLADALGMRFASGPARGRRPHERVALLSRFPIISMDARWFWDGGDHGERRGAVVAEVATPAGPLRCAVAHLSTRPRERARERRFLAAMIASLPGPALLFIDANSARLAPLGRVADLRPPPGRPLATFPAERPSKPVDWILARVPARHLGPAWTPEHGISSDHLPLLVVVGLC
jgi:endonuclease/exonuclease/phosphatase family metal-dependent hydrolase